MYQFRVDLKLYSTDSFAESHTCKAILHMQSAIDNLYQIEEYSVILDATR